MTSCAGAAPSQPHPAEPLVCPAMLAWSVGLDDPKGPDRMVETILPALVDGRAIWRITHREQDPSGTATNDFDLYDVDRATLAPLRSMWVDGESRLAIAFGPERATITTRDGETTLLLAGPVAPEGPGETAYVASLPLAPGYRHSYQIVDRWAMPRPRLARMTLTVIGRETIGGHATFVIEIVPDDRSFSIVERVLAAAPHYAIRTEYIRGPLHLRSEVTSFSIGC
jgi:hypothetical protein